MQNINIATGEDRREGIARRLTAVRTHHGLNQTAFAERLGFARRTYLSWERGDADPPVWLLDGLKREFDVDPFWLLHGPGDRVMPHGASIDWDRLSRLQDVVWIMMRELNLAPQPAQAHELARGLFETPQNEEAAAIARLRSTLSTLHGPDVRQTKRR